MTPRHTALVDELTWRRQSMMIHAGIDAFCESYYAVHVGDGRRRGEPS